MTIDSNNPADESVGEELEAPEIENDADIDPDTGEENDPPAEPEVEEVEHEGQKYKIPKALKPALLMQADYTRKTQEIAEQRRQWEAQSAQAHKVQSEHLTDIGKVVALNDVIAQFEKADWSAIRANNAAAAQDLWIQYQQTKDSRDKAVTELQQKVQARSIEEQRETAKRLEDAQTVLARDIKDWSPDLAGKLGKFATERFGFTTAELGQVTDPRVIKLLHAAFVGGQAQSKNSATKIAEAAKLVQPLPTVAGNGAPKKGLTDKLSAEEWVRRRNQQLAKKKKR